MCAYLRRTCAFRQHTIEGILSLEKHSNDSGSPLTVLQNYIKENDPYTYSVTPTWQKQMESIERNMRDRIEEIKCILLKCESYQFCNYSCTYEEPRTILNAISLFFSSHRKIREHNVYTFSVFPEEAT